MSCGSCCEWCGEQSRRDDDEVDDVEPRELDDDRFRPIVEHMKRPPRLHGNCLDDIFETDTLEVEGRLLSP